MVNNKMSTGNGNLALALDGIINKLPVFFSFLLIFSFQILQKDLKKLEHAFKQRSKKDRVGGILSFLKTGSSGPDAVVSL